MSTFTGRMQEYRFITIDCFTGANLSSSMFFLSHCHQDHMIGLDQKLFSDLLELNSYKLYCHSVTAQLLLSDIRYAHLRKHVVALSTNESHLLLVPSSVEGQSLTVTLFGSGHCPGSVMFLFEGSEGNVLYTGDFRLSVDDVRAMKLLHQKYDLGPKLIKAMYFDSTFCQFAGAISIPSRKESLTTITELTGNWLNAPLKRRKGRKVLLYCCARYGHEYLMSELCKHHGMKLHVTGSKLAAYREIPELAKFVTDDASETALHACAFWEDECDIETDLTTQKEKKSQRKPGRNMMTTCPDCPAWSKDVLVIKPSMMWFATLKTFTGVVHRELNYLDGRYVRVKYSSHSSLEEIRAVIAYIQPRTLYPNVVPNGSSVDRVLATVAESDDGSSQRFDRTAASTDTLPTFPSVGATLLKRNRYLEKCRRIKKRRQHKPSASEAIAEADQEILRLSSSSRSPPNFSASEKETVVGKRTVSNQSDACDSRSQVQLLNTAVGTPPSVVTLSSDSSLEDYSVPWGRSQSAVNLGPSSSAVEKRTMCAQNHRRDSTSALGKKGSSVSTNSPVAGFARKRCDPGTQHYLSSLV